jgi:hypothetical protein
VTDDRLRSNDHYVPTIAAAAVDILGVQRLASKLDGSLAAINVLSKFVRNASPWLLSSPSTELASRHTKMYDVEVYFGDSLYLFADQSIILEEQILNLTIRVATLVAVGLLVGAPRFLVRGGIAIGDLRKRLITRDGVDREIRIGTSMTRAHQLQECQDWIGGAIDGTAPRNSETSRWTFGYPAPLKKSCDLDAVPVPLNWIWKDGTPEGIENKLRLASEEISAPTTRSQTILQNTSRFIRAVCQAGRFAPFSGSMLP